MILPAIHQPLHVTNGIRMQLGGDTENDVDRDAFRSVETAVALLRTAKDLAPEAFAWRTPPYEYEAEKMPIDMLWGSEALRAGIDGGASVEVMPGVEEELARFQAAAAPYLLY